ncbi:integrase arm-type DNA-binding domain-containing protein, partial [Metallibacterium sp.]|uniref:tyrosine-type recombinase/integrase n=1 Tax=Metallibacterium sp. TaxID=2940281 RepID=UPI0026157A37
MAEKKLAEVAVRNAKPRDRSYKLSDGGGLHLQVNPTGSRWWRLRYTFDGKEQMLSLGVYPAVSLRDARDRRDEARRMLAKGINPSIRRRAEQVAASDSFEAIAREWHGKFKSRWSEGHAALILHRLQRDAFPWLGSRNIAEITAPQLLTVLRRIEHRGAVETAHRILQVCGQVFRYAVATGRAERDPSADLRGALPPSKAKHLASITDPARIGELLRAIDSYRGSFIVRCALRLSPLLFVRPGELRKAEWREFDLDTGEWRIPAARMKARAPHVVPLARQSLEILRELAPLTSGGHYVFPGNRSEKRPMSENTTT